MGRFLWRDAPHRGRPACQRRLATFVTMLFVSALLVSCGGTGGSQAGGGSTQPITSNAPPFRMRFVRTDAAALYPAVINLHWIVYSPLTGRFFVTDPITSRVTAIDATTETVVGSIPVPGAFGIDDTPDHSSIFVGTIIGDVYQIDPVKMTVTHRYPAVQIGPNGFQANSVQVMADGQLALLGGQYGVSNNQSEYPGFAIWNPADNSISVYQPPASCGITFIGAFGRTPDRTKVVLVSPVSDHTVCELDESSGAAISYTDSSGAIIDDFAITPDGKSIIIPGPGYPGNAMVLDASTLSLVKEFPIQGATSTAANFFVSPDSTTLYTTSDTSPGAEGIVYAYNLATGQQVGWLPDIFVAFPYSGLASAPAYNPILQAADGTGLIAGPVFGGVGFLDTTALRAGPVDQGLSPPLYPATGLIGGGTQITWDWPPWASPIADAYIGSQKAESLSATSSYSGESATTPPGAPGPAGFYALSSGGTVLAYDPEGFSYGPTILQVTPNYSTAAGGGTGTVYGYGFGPMLEASLGSTSIPPGLQVTVGGQAAKITSFTWQPNVSPSSSFPLQAFTYTIPSGVAGTSVDVTVTSSSGTVTAHSGITYLPAVQQFPAPGATLAQGIYDPYNDFYYFTDATQIRIFSLADHLWQPPTPIPAADNPQRLWGIALSPDGSKLAVSDIQGQAIYVLDPANPSSVEKFTLPQGTNPVGVAVTNGGTVYFVANVGYFSLDTSTGQVMNFVGGYGLDAYLRTVLNPAGTAVYFNSSGSVVSIDTATGKMSYAPLGSGSGGNDELTMDADGTRLAATDYLYAPNLNAESYFALNDREVMNISYIYGQKLSPDGHLLFQPTNLGIDVMDGRLGTLLDRIAISVPLSPNYDALVSDGKDNNLVAITGANGDGIAVIDLTSIPDPPALPYDPTASVAATLSAMKATPSTLNITQQKKAGIQLQPTPYKHLIPHVTVRNLLLQHR